jgi:DNA-binding response OmpR family regulator
LVVDDEEDVLDTVEELLGDCMISKTNEFSTARQYLLGYTYYFGILDIMGVNGFELLKIFFYRGFPTIMLTAYLIITDNPSL